MCHCSHELPHVSGLLNIGTGLPQHHRLKELNSFFHVFVFQQGDAGTGDAGTGDAGEMQGRHTYCSNLGDTLEWTPWLRQGKW
jgi:hypothetical protein